MYRKSYHDMATFVLIRVPAVNNPETRNVVIISPAQQVGHLKNNT